MKVVINMCFGGFGLSNAALARYNELGNTAVDYACDIERHDVDLVHVVEEMGADAYDRFSSLKVVEIPDGIEYVIEDYDGMEHVAEAHRTWS